VPHFHDAGNIRWLTVTGGKKMHAQDTHITQWEVLVHPTIDETVRGVLRFNQGKPTITLESGDVIHSETEGVTFSIEHKIIVGEKGQSKFVKLKDRIRIVLDPFITRDFPYSPHLTIVEEDMYPPSTSGWYGRYILAPADAIYSYEESPFIYLVQQIQDHKQFWLTIVQRETGVIFESHFIQQYEEPILRMTSSMEYRKHRIKTLWDLDSLKTKALRILDGPPPTWEQLSYLARGISIQDLKVKETMRASLDSLVPKSVPFEQREQIKAFLALTLSIPELPSEDPVEYLEQYLGTRLLRDLLSIHLRIIAQGSPPPDYVSIMHAAQRGEIKERGSSEGPKVGVIRGLKSTLLKPPYYKHYWKEIIRHIDSLNESKKLSTGLPVLKSEAKKSEAAWLSRIELMMAGTRIHAQVSYPSIGLVLLTYYGSAHTWPHYHLAWYAKTIDISNVKLPRTRYLQTMVMPSSSAQQVKRAMTNISEIDLSFRRVNYNFYSPSSGEWRVNIAKILSSMNRKSSVRKLKREFGIPSGKFVHNISLNEAQAIDAVMSHLYLEDSELLGPSLYGLTSDQLLESLEYLQSLGVISINYEANVALEDISTSYVTVAEGNPDYVCSFVKAFLNHTPSSLVFLEKGATRTYIISRMPKTSAYELIRSLPEVGEFDTLNIRCSEIQGYRDYQFNLLQRLHNDDNSWNSDIHELLIQAR
jgi:hypothetical protein